LSTESFEIRYPDGDFEVDNTVRTPVVGDTIWRKGRPWKVTHMTSGSPVVVHVEIAADRDGELEHEGRVRERLV
jgi:hypothetical protein